MKVLFTTLLFGLVALVLCNSLRPLYPPVPLADDSEDSGPDEQGPDYDSCPERDPMKYSVHLPHPECKLYYICVHGTPIERPCANGTHWNSVNITCDWPIDAQCVEGSAKLQPNAITLY